MKTNNLIRGIHKDDEDDDDDEDNDEEKKSRNDPARLIKTHEEHGWPLIPRRGDMPLNQLKNVIRAYVTATYRGWSWHSLSLSYIPEQFTGQFTNNNRASVPWRCMSHDLQYEYVDPASLPNGVMLLDPSKLRVVGISDIWDHWARRQKNNSQGLVFRKAQEGDMREKGKKGEKDYVDPDDGDDNDQGTGSNLDQGVESSSSVQPHPDSPATKFTEWPVARLEFLRSLSDDAIYQRFANQIMLKIGVSSSYYSGEQSDRSWKTD